MNGRPPPATPVLAALGVVAQGGEVLLVRRRSEPDAGLWGFPGGHVDLGETVGEAACREIREETTLHTRPGPILAGLDIITRDGNGDIAYHFHLVAVLCTYLSGTPEGRDDVHEAAWIPAGDVLDRRLPLSADVDTVLRRAMEAGAG